MVTDLFFFFFLPGIECDFDIAGTYDAMIPDAEIVRIIVDVFEALGLREDITIKINHRKILDGLFTVAGVPEDKIRSISSAVDKLDKVRDKPPPMYRTSLTGLSRRGKKSRRRWKKRVFRPRSLTRSVNT